IRNRARGHSGAGRVRSLMSIDEIVDRYFAAWSAHDSTAVAGLFASQTAVVYEDPTTRVAVRAGDLESVMRSLAVVAPDFQFRITSRAVDHTRAMVEWVLTGTNTSPIKPGIMATGKTLHLVGVDVLDAGSPDGLTRVRRYFDQHTMCEQ